jgi:hypothetical protein
MNIFWCKPNEPTGIHRFDGITADAKLVTQGHSDASVLLLLNGRDVLTVFPVALIAPPDLNLEEVHRMRPFTSVDGDWLEYRRACEHACNLLGQDLRHSNVVRWPGNGSLQASGC